MIQMSAGSTIVSEPIHDNNFEGGICKPERGLVRFAANADNKFVAAFLRKSSLSSYLRQLHFDKEPLRSTTVLVEIISLDVP